VNTTPRAYDPRPALESIDGLLDRAVLLALLPPGAAPQLGTRAGAPPSPLALCPRNRDSSLPPGARAPRPVRTLVPDARRNPDMRKLRVPAVLAVLALLCLAACTRVPITGRRQLSLIPSSEMNALSFQQYAQFLQQNQLSTNAAQTARVEKVGHDIQLAVERYFNEQGQAAALEGYAWEFHLVQSDEVNAWCMPGGKVVVYTGLLPLTQDATGLAVVMGHEIAHAVANHGGERMSQAMLTELGGMALQQALAQKSEETRAIFLTAFGVGSQVGVLLPYSRLHETEADHLGLIFMAMAGYDPEQAPAFWERMAAQNQGGAPPEFLSTHPSDETRLRKIRELLPEAKQYYRKG